MSFFSLVLLYYKYLDPKTGPTMECECIETNVACIRHAAQLMFHHSVPIRISRKFLYEKENVKIIVSMTQFTGRRENNGLTLKCLYGENILFTIFNVNWIYRR